MKNTHLGGCNKLDREGALRSAKERKAKALGISCCHVPISPQLPPHLGQLLFNSNRTCEVLRTPITLIVGGTIFKSYLIFPLPDLRGYGVAGTKYNCL